MPTKQKLLAALVILASSWASVGLSSYLSTIFVWRSAAFDKLSNSVSQQDPIQLQKTVQELFRSAAQARDILLLLPLVEWGTRALLAYLAACVIMTIIAERRTPNQALQPPAPTSSHEQSLPASDRAPTLVIVATTVALVALIVFYLIIGFF